MMSYLALAAFIATIPAANWLIGNVGTVCIPDGPCLIPVAPGLMAPSGVMLIGLALVLRDVVQERLGLRWAMAAIVIGAALSATFAPLPLAIASGVAFLVSEVADLSVYTPLRRRGLWLAVLASGIVGSVIDSAIFLQFAFGSIDHIAGNIVGKIWMSILALPFLIKRRTQAQP